MELFIKYYVLSSEPEPLPVLESWSKVSNSASVSLTSLSASQENKPIVITTTAKILTTFLIIFVFFWLENLVNASKIFWDQKKMNPLGNVLVFAGIVLEFVLKV